MGKNKNRDRKQQARGTAEQQPRPGAHEGEQNRPMDAETPGTARKGRARSFGHN